MTLDPSKSRQGISILELAVCLAILGPVLMGMTIVLDIGIRYFARGQAAQLYHLHVEPLEILLNQQVRNCRFAVYDSLGDARLQDNAAIVPSGNVLRADRFDGGGWFILQWDDPNHALNLITDSGPGLVLTRSIRRWSGEMNLFDTTQGFLALRCSLPVPTALVTIYGENTLTVDYLLTVERQL